MKKFLAAAIIVLSISTSAFAEQNYTLQTTNVQQPTSPVARPSSGGTDTVSTFLNNVGNAFNDNNVKQSSELGSIISSQAGRRTSSQRNSQSTLIATSGRDPYLLEINGVRYMMVKDNKDGVFNQNDLLGINDTTNSIFKSLKPLDTNGDLKLTGKELTKAGIRLVRIGSDGKLIYKDKTKDFKNSDVIFIHLTEIRKAYKNNGQTGDFGYYDVVIKNGIGEKMLVTGVVTFETDEQIQKYF